MKSRLVVVWLCSILLLTSPEVLAQQAATSNQSWNVLQQTLSTGKVMVEKKNGRKVTGELKSLSDTELVIERKGKPETFSRDEVKNVWTVAPPSRMKQTVFGAAGLAGGLFAGIFIAVGLGFKDCGGSCADEGTGIVAALIGLPVAGVFAGRWLAGSGKRMLVYSAP
jgi:hypothetical protein